MRGRDRATAAGRRQGPMSLAKQYVRPETAFVLESTVDIEHCQFRRHSAKKSGCGDYTHLEHVAYELFGPMQFQRLLRSSSTPDRKLQETAPSIRHVVDAFDKAHAFERLNPA